MSTAGSRRSASPSRASHGGMTYNYNAPIIASSKIPSGRGGASIVEAEGKLIAFGGTYMEGDGFAYLDETWVLDVRKLSWHGGPIGANSRLRCSRLRWSMRPLAFAEEASLAADFNTT